MWVPRSYPWIAVKSGPPTQFVQRKKTTDSASQTVHVTPRLQKERLGKGSSGAGSIITAVPLETDVKLDQMRMELGNKWLKAED